MNIPIDKHGRLSYDICGLKGIILVNGFTVYRTGMAEEISITNIESLHRAIAVFLLSRDGESISGRELQFLRKLSGITLHQAADICAIDAVTLHRIEHDDEMLSPEMTGPFTAHMQGRFPATPVPVNDSIIFRYSTTSGSWKLMYLTKCDTDTTFSDRGRVSLQYV